MVLLTKGEMFGIILSDKMTKRGLSMKLLNWVKSYFTPTEEISPRTNNFNIIRFFAAFMVIYGHMSSIMGYDAFAILGQRVSTIGVKILFTFSGYLITKSYLSDTHFGRYMIRRSFRIFPAFIVLILLTALVGGPLLTSLSVGEYFGNPWTWRYIWSNLLFSPIYILPGVFTENAYPNAVNGSLWTLPFEFAMYLILPALLVLFKKLKSARWGMFAMWAVSLAASLLLLVKYPWGGARLVIWGNNLPDALALIPYFFIGSLFSFPEFKKLLNLQLAVLLLIVGVLALSNVWYSPIVASVFNELVVSLVLPYFVLSLALTERPIFSKWFANSDFAYGLYLYGFVVQQAMYQLMAPTKLSVLEMTVVCFAVTLVFAIASWYLVEKPVQKLGQAWIRRLKREK